MIKDAILSKDNQCPFKVGSGHFRQDPYSTLAWFRGQSAATIIEANGYRMWLLTRYADAKRLLGDASFCKDIVAHRRLIVPQCAIAPGKSAHIPHESRRSLVDRDGPDHRRLRGIVRRSLSRRVTINRRADFEALASQILDELPLGVAVDLIEAYARPLCMRFISGLYGVPEKTALEFPQWDNALLTGSSIEEVEAGGRELFQFGLRMIDHKRKQPGDDVFTDLLHAHASGELDKEELASTYIVLMLGAGEVANAIASGLLLLLSHPAHYEALRHDSTTITDCVEEVLRCESPFRLLPPRFRQQQVELNGITIPKGELIAVSPAAANRDPEHFPDPEHFDPSRHPRSHLAFGHGAHACPGSQFARMEMAVALLMFVERFDECKLALPREKARWRGGDFMRRLDVLSVTLRRK